MPKLPPEPEKPLNSDCCGGGACCPCIWDVYYEKLAEWREAKRQREQEAALSKAAPDSESSQNARNP